MGKPELGAFIRQIDYLAAKDGNDYENSDDNPGNQLIDIENKCGDISFDELKDAFAAFEEKVCVERFPEKHSSAYCVAYSTVCVLDRLSSKFVADHEDMAAKVTAMKLHSMMALIKAGPTTTHTELFDKLINNDVEDYVKTLGRTDLIPLMTAAKIKFRYIPNDDCDEYYYGYFQKISMKKFFKMIRSEQYILIQKEFLEIYIHYHSQLTGLPEKYANEIDNLIEGMTEKFEDGNPYLKLKEPGIIKKHIDIIKDMVRSEGYTEGSPTDHSAERTLSRIIKAVLADRYLPDVFDHLISTIIELNKNDNFRKEGTNIYQKYINQLFGSLKENQVPVEKLYKSCVDLVVALRSHDHMTSMNERLIYESNGCVIMKVKQATPENVKLTLPMVIRLLESGRESLIVQAESNLKHLKKTKSLDWKKHIDSAQKILETIGKIPKEKLQDDSQSDLHGTVSAYKSFLRMFWDQLKKAKVLPQLQSSFVNFIFDCLEIDPPSKCELAEDCSGKDNLDFTKEDSLRLVVLEKAYQILKLEIIPQDDRYMGTTISNVVKKVIESYDGNGKKVTKEENDLFMAIFKYAGEGGDSVVEHFYDEEIEELPNYKMLIWLELLSYAQLQQETGSGIAPVIPEIIRWSKIAHAEDHDTMTTLCFGVLNLVGIAAPTELKSSTEDLIDLMLESGKCNEWYPMVNLFLYPHNPEAVQSKLQSIFDNPENFTENERNIILTQLQTVSQEHPEAITEKQISRLIEMYTKGDQESKQLILIIIKAIAEKCPKNLAKFFTQLCDEQIFQPDSLNWRSGILACIGGVNENFGQKAVDYLMKHVSHSETPVANIIMSTLGSMVKQHKDYMQKYKAELEKLEQTSTVQQVRDTAHDIILILEGKSLESIAEGMEQQREDIAELDSKVDTTIGTVITIGDKVLQHDTEIGDLQTGLGKVEERVDNVEEDHDETKVKIEEIDNKTMTNAPKWSRDLTKLMNPTTENDWRLLARRLGYSNDDIRSWATQYDPCMAVLSEWYATHKTSEANYGVLTALTEMNRIDGVAIVENAMKAAEGVVEDDEFEYPSPPPVFISYQWGFQNEVKLLKQHLNMAGYECWMDVGQMGGGDKLFAKIDNGIRGAKVVICCVTEKYSQSPNCNREVNLSVNVNKPIIPLLMEKMDWPPKGSMGPIFSEYLFIRFFQRGGEETPDNDQRYWPIPKFQELLMQLNFYVVPEQKMIQAEYAKWWEPIIEDIVIDKNKGKKQGSTQKQTDAQVLKPGDSPLVFLSYQWGKQPQVKALYQRLTSLGYTVWMDIYQMGGGDSLYDKIDRGMRGCKAVVSCVTPKYSLSANCRREVSLADALKKPIIPLLLEQMKWPPDGPMSMVFTELLYINFSKDEAVQLTWSCDQFNELISKLDQYIPETTANGNKTSDKSHKGMMSNDKQKNKETMTKAKAKFADSKGGENILDKTKSKGKAQAKKSRDEPVKPKPVSESQSKKETQLSAKTSGNESTKHTYAKAGPGHSNTSNRMRQSDIHNQTKVKTVQPSLFPAKTNDKKEPVKVETSSASYKQPFVKQERGKVEIEGSSGDKTAAVKTSVKLPENEMSEENRKQKNNKVKDSKSKACAIL